MKKLTLILLAVAAFSAKAQTQFTIHAMDQGSYVTNDGYTNYYQPSYMHAYTLHVADNAYSVDHWHYTTATYLHPTGTNAWTFTDNRSQGTDKIFIMWVNHGIAWATISSPGSPQIGFWVQKTAGTGPISKGYMVNGATWIVWMLEYDNSTGLIGLTQVESGTGIYESDLPNFPVYYEGQWGQFSTNP
jgi:hypothetical protein